LLRLRAWRPDYSGRPTCAWNRSRTRTQQLTLRSSLAVCFALPHPATFHDPIHVNAMTKAAAGYFCGDPPLARMSGYCGDFKKLRNGWAMHPEDFVPSSVFGWRRRFRCWRLKRAGRLSHLVWEVVCVKPFP
jgi:hypothetical protein